MARQSLARRDSALPANVLKDAVIQRLLEADRALQHATTIPQVKLVADVASAMEVLAKRQQLGAEIQAKAHEIETYAMAKLGSMTKDMPKADGGTHGGRPSKLGTRREPSLTAPATYADLGLNKKTISKAQQLADLPAHAITAIASGEKTFAKVRREHKAHAVAEKVSLPDAKFRVIVADPPWKYGNAIDEAMPGTTVAESHYPCLSIPELCALPVTHKNNTASSSQRSPHVKLVADVASAMKVLAKRQQLGAEIQAKAHEIETYAMAKLGSMTKQMPKATGTRGQGRPKLGDTAVVSPKHTSPIAARKMWGFQ